jgi:hypothetical protein
LRLPFLLEYHGFILMVKVQNRAFLQIEFYRGELVVHKIAYLQNVSYSARIGSSVDTQGHFSGLIDELLIFNTSLSASDIASYSADKYRPPTGLVAHFTMDEGKHHRHCRTFIHLFVTH